MNNKIIRNFSKDFFIAGTSKKDTASTNCIVDIWTGCKFLNKLFEKKLLHIIIIICSYLNWIDVSRASELVNFQLLECLNTKKRLNQIFKLNSEFLHSTSIIDLDYNYLTSLEPKQLFTHYQLLHRNPKFNRFGTIALSGLLEQHQVAKFHPVLPLCASFFDSILVVSAYDCSSSIRKKCWSTGILHLEQGPETYGIQDMSWSPLGTYLCVVYVGGYFDSPPGFQEPQNFDQMNFLNCNDCKRKAFVIYMLDSQSGQLQKIKISKNTNEIGIPICKWHQSSGLWNDDHILTFYNHQGLINRIVLDGEKKVATFHSFRMENEKIFFNEKEKFLHLISHPNKQHTLLFTSTCYKKRHYHHRISVYDLASEKRTFTIHIPGVITNIIPDNKKAHVVVVYRIFQDYQYTKSAFSTSTNNDECPFEGPNNYNFPQYMKYYRHISSYDDYYWDLDLMEETIDREPKIRLLEINLDSVEDQKQLIHDSFDELIGLYRRTYGWHKWTISAKAMTEQITDFHVILKNQEDKPIIKIGRIHQSISIITPTFKKSIKLNRSPWIYHPSEHFFLYSLDGLLNFFYFPSVMNFEERCAYHKKYLLMKNDTILFTQVMH